MGKRLATSVAARCVVCGKKKVNARSLSRILGLFLIFAVVAGCNGTKEESLLDRADLVFEGSLAEVRKTGKPDAVLIGPPHTISRPKYIHTFYVEKKIKGEWRQGLFSIEAEGEQLFQELTPGRRYRIFLKAQHSGIFIALGFAQTERK